LPRYFHVLQTGEIKALAGVDFLTISPTLLEELRKSTEKVEKKLDAAAGEHPIHPNEGDRDVHGFHLQLSLPIPYLK
jgi:transaldolase